MGEEIESHIFSEEDFREFEKRLKTETELLGSWFDDRAIDDGPPLMGAELEAWLVDGDCEAAPKNGPFIDRHGDPMVFPELSEFNIEFNTDPVAVAGNAFDVLERNLRSTFEDADHAAKNMDLKIATIGILPTIRDDQLTLENMSKWERYRALNEQIFRLREGKPISLDIKNFDHIKTKHFDVMLEAGATSYQVHLKVTQDNSAAYYNASKIASGPLVAVSANSPYLFGFDLWAETRIPLFEQAISVGDWDYSERVTFGVRYIEHSLFEVFAANRQRYPVMLPQLQDKPPEALSHLKMHNGSIWRWNRPIVGFEDDGTPHIRIEQRVVPAGPTVADAIANTAFYVGLATGLVIGDTPPSEVIPFHVSRDNFYTCAKDGLDAIVTWEGRERGPVRELLTEKLIPIAKEGLISLGIDDSSISRCLGIILERARSGQNGAKWQRDYVRASGRDMRRLLEAYLERQHTGRPVHEWDI